MIRREAAKALQDLGATGAIEPLLEALQVESKDLTVWAMLEAVGELGNPSVLPTLESLSNVDSMLTRIEVKKCIDKIRERHGDRSMPQQQNQEETAPAQKRTIQPSESVLPEDTPHPDSDTREAEETEEDRGSLLHYLLNRSKPRPARAAKTTDEHDQEQADISVEDTFEKPSVEPDRITGMESEENVDEEDYTPSTEASEETAPETEFVENMVPDAELPESDEDSEIHNPELSEPEDTEGPNKEHRDPDEDREINDLVESISRSPRLAGSSVALPVLAPNAATVPYHPNVAPSEEKNENFFLAVLHPGRYLSKRWVSRTRVYLILWGILLAATIGFMQYQKYRSAKETSVLSMGLSATEVPDLVKRSLAEGDFYIQEGHYKQAISAYQLSRELGVLPIHFYRKLGFAYFREGQYALAVEAYELFLEERENVPPDVFTAEASLSGMYPTTSVATKVVQDYETYNILGTAYMKLERLQDAQHAYELAIRLAPKYGEAYNNLARLYVDGYQQKLNLAETLAYTAVTLNPNVAAYHNTLGWVLAKRGQVNKAIKALERSIDLQSDSVEAHYHLAQIALKAGERKKAIKSIRNVLKLNPAYVHLNASSQEP
jgi:tetratricopeptide (TPR) repeat protein